MDLYFTSKINRNAIYKKRFKNSFELLLVTPRKVGFSTVFKFKDLSQDSFDDCSQETSHHLSPLGPLQIIRR